MSFQYLKQNRLPLVAIGVGDASLFAVMPDAGVVATAITALALAVIGAVAAAFKSLGPLWIEFMEKRERVRQDLAARDEERNKASFQRMIMDMKRELDFTKECYTRLLAENDRLSNHLNFVDGRLDRAHERATENTKAIQEVKENAVIKAIEENTRPASGEMPASG